MLSVGDVVSFSYERNPKTDMPYNPKIVRIRSDVAWEDVAQDSFGEKKQGIYIFIQLDFNLKVTILSVLILFFLFFIIFILLPFLFSFFLLLS